MADGSTDKPKKAGINWSGIGRIASGIIAGAAGSVIVAPGIWGSILSPDNLRIATGVAAIVGSVLPSVTGMGSGAGAGAGAGAGPSTTPPK